MSWIYAKLASNHYYHYDNHYKHYNDYYNKKEA